MKSLKNNSVVLGRRRVLGDTPNCQKSAIITNHYSAGHSGKWSFFTPKFIPRPLFQFVDDKIDREIMELESDIFSGLAQVKNGMRNFSILWT